MKIKINSVKEILDDKISLIERGILITILLLKEDDPKLTLAKVKAKIKLGQVREELINLQDLGIIEWSGYNLAKKSLLRENVTPNIELIIKFMNNLYGTKFNPKSKTVYVNLSNRLNDYSVEEVKLVIANRWKVWKDDAFGQKYLTPYTIFRPSKFDKYFEEANRTRIGESIISAKNINLKNGDEITLSVVGSFIDSEKYNIRTWKLDVEGKRRGNGMVGIRKGKDVKQALKIQNTNIMHGERREFLYTYISK